MAWQPWPIEWSKPAQHDLGSIDKGSRKHISDAVDKYASTGVGNIGAVKGKQGVYRLKLPPWRVFYKQILQPKRKLVILRVLRRNERTYD